MRKESEIDFVSLLRDETFLKLVRSTEGHKDQLDILEKEYPGQRTAIDYAIEFLRINHSDQKRMHLNDVSLIWRNIRKYANQRRTLRGRIVILKLLKAAAVLVFILAGALVAWQRLNNDPLEKIAATRVSMGDKAMIILSDGSKHKLDINDSRIEYRSDGGEVVIKNDKQEEKIEIAAASKAAKINQIIVPYGQRHILTLSDGTRVQLNSGSRMVFPAEFLDKKREVYLIGEGYFEVTKNPDKPFIVKTNFVNIKVLGTVFNISAYEDEQMATTVLVEGKVVVSQKNKLFGYTENKLEPGQGCFYSSASFTSEIRKVDLYEHVSWKDGLLPFRDRALVNIVNRVEKYYNHKVLIEGEKLANTLISGKLVLSDNIDEAVQYLAKTVEGGFDKKEDGSYLIKNSRN